MVDLKAPFSAARTTTLGNYGDRRYRNAFGQWITHYHCGVDYALGAGTVVRAAGAGTVVEVSHSKVRGYMVAIDHGGGIGTRYHMLASANRPRVGQWIEQGAAVGRVADADEQGSSSSGDHVHVEVRINGAIRGETTDRRNTPSPHDYFRGVIITAGLGSNPIGAIMAKDDKFFDDLKNQINDVQLRVASMHGGSFLPWPGVPGAPGGTLKWLDDAIERVLKRVPEGQSKQIGDIQDRVASMHVGQYLPIRPGAPGGDLAFLDRKLAEIESGPQVDVESAEIATALAVQLVADPDFAAQLTLSVAERAEIEQYRADRARRLEELLAELESLGAGKVR